MCGTKGAGQFVPLDNKSLIKKIFLSMRREALEKRMARQVLDISTLKPAIYWQDPAGREVTVDLQSISWLKCVGAVYCVVNTHKPCRILTLKSSNNELGSLVLSTFKIIS